MTQVPKRTVVRLSREQRVEEILAVALEVFSEKGFECSTVEIAERAGVVEGTVYKYFQTKRELLLKALESWYSGLVEDYARDLAGIRGFRERFRYLVWRHLCEVRNAPNLSRLLFSEARSNADYRDSPLQLKSRRYTGFIIKVVQEGIDAGELRSDIPLPLVRNMVFGGIEHHAWSFLYGHGHLEPEAVADQITLLVCEGLALQKEDDALRTQVERLARLATRMEKAEARMKKSRDAE